eukprot:scaffold212865_cov48-Prasinocladus_malaysianus.AAC.2
MNSTVPGLLHTWLGQSEGHQPRHQVRAEGRKSKGSHKCVKDIARAQLTGGGVGGRVKTADGRAPVAKSFPEAQQRIASTKRCPPDHRTPRGHIAQDDHCNHAQHKETHQDRCPADAGHSWEGCRSVKSGGNGALAGPCEPSGCPPEQAQVAIEGDHLSIERQTVAVQEGPLLHGLPEALSSIRVSVCVNDDREVCNPIGPPRSWSWEPHVGHAVDVDLPAACETLAGHKHRVSAKRVQWVAEAGKVRGDNFAAQSGPLQLPRHMVVELDFLALRGQMRELAHASLLAGQACPLLPHSQAPNDTIAP